MERFFLPICVQQYDHWDKLDGGVRDETAMRDILCSPTYRFRLLTDELVGGRVSERDIRTWLKELSSIPKEAQLIIYYSGHGHRIEDDDSGYWIPSEGVFSEDGTERKGWIDNLGVVKQVSKIRCQQILFINDSCFSGQLAQTCLGISKARSRKGMCVREILTSCDETEVVFDPSDRSLSPFVYHLTSLLRNNIDESLSVTSLHSNLVKCLDSEYSPRHLHLYKYGHELGAQFLFTNQLREKPPSRSVTNSNSRSFAADFKNRVNKALKFLDGLLAAHHSWRDSSGVNGQRLTWSLFKDFIALCENTDAFLCLDLTDMRDADFRNAKFPAWITLCGALLDGCDFSDGCFDQVNFGSACLTNAKFVRSSLINATFFYSDLKKTSFSYANLEGATFHDAKAVSCDFSHANMTKANFKNASLRKSIFSKATAKGADFSGSDFSSSSLDQMNLSGANITDTCLSGISCSEWILDKLVCGRIHWDAARNNKTVYKKGEFENKFKEGFYRRARVEKPC